MTIFLSPWTARCPSCHRSFVNQPQEALPSGNATLARIEAVCPCGHVYRLAYRRRPVADDERRAGDVRWWRQAVRLRRGAERVVAEAVLRHLGSMSLGWEG